MIAVVVLKSGQEISISCNDFKIEKAADGGIANMLFYNPQGCELMFVAHGEIAAVYRIFDDKKRGEASG